MDDGTVGVELDAESGAPSRTQSQSVRKNISLKLKPKMRGRPKKGPAAKRRSQEGRDSQAEIVNTEEEIPNENRAPKFDMEEDISKLEAPKFSTIDRGPPEPIHDNNKLKWDYKVNLIGEKVINPMIHCCKKCDLPVLTYGRMIPCKHVFCHDCAKKTDKLCPKCNEKVHRVEQTGLGTVFMCTFGGSCHGNDGCCRTYLSQRDLHAHINHRHVRASAPSSTTPTSSNLTSTVSNVSAPSIVKEAPKMNHQPPQTNQNEYKPHLPPITVGNASMPTERHPWGTALPTCRPPQSMLGGPHAHLHMGPPPPPHIGMTEAQTSVQNPYNLDAATLHLHRASAVAAAAAAAISGQPPRGNMQVHPGYVQAQNTLGYGAPSQIPVMSTRTNLITVPIQDESGGGQRPPPPHQGQGPPVTHHAQASPTGIPYVPPPTLYPPHPRGPPPTMTRPPSLNSYPNPVPVSYATAMTTQAYVQHHQVPHYGGAVGAPTGSPGGLRTSVAPPPLYNTSQPPPPPPVHHVYGSSAPRTHYPPPPQQPPGYGQGWVGMGAGPAPGAQIRPHPPPPHGMQQQPPGHPRPPMYH